jgi:hypothetical protein
MKPRLIYRDVLQVMMMMMIMTTMVLRIITSSLTNLNKFYHGSKVGRVTHTQNGDLISLFPFFLESGLKRKEKGVSEVNRRRHVDFTWSETAWYKGWQGLCVQIDCSGSRGMRGTVRREQPL